LCFFASAQTVDLTILHTNDQHGHLLPQDIAGQKMVGGMAPRMTLVREIKNEVAHKGGYVLLLDGGDLNTGDPIADMFMAKPNIAIMNKMGYQAMAVGNHEFDHELPDILEQQKLAQFPFLSANVFYKKTGKLIFTPLIVWKIHDLTVAAFGITAPDTPSISTCGSDPSLWFWPAEAVITEILQGLRGRVDFIIAIIHMDHPNVLRLAQAFPDIDMIIGAHTHLPMPTAAKVGKTWIAEAGCYGEMMARWDLQFRERRLCDVRYQLLGINLSKPLTDDQGNITCQASPKIWPPDPEIEDFLKPYIKEAQKIFDIPIGAASDDMPRGKRGSFPKSSPLGNLIADAIREKVNADIGLQNIGGIRADLLKGTITPGDISRILPFANTLVTCELSGKQILELLAVLVDRDPNNGGFFEVSGISFRVQNKKAQEVYVAGKPLALEQKYKVVTNSFIAKGGDGYKIFDTFAKVDTGFVLSQAVLAYVKKYKNLQPNHEVRMQWLP
jgi:5'-nucleotidase/UDP-sugar diphosphatase